MACDPTTLAAQAACIQCNIPDGLKLAVLISLLCQIRDNGTAGGGGVTSLIAGTNITLNPAGGTGAVTINATGGGGTFAGVGSPQNVQVGSPGNTYLDTSGNHFWAKATGTGTNTGWVELIA